MSLDAIDWPNLTRRDAIRLRTMARQAERKAGARFERDEISEAEFLAAVQLEEDLHVFVLCGEGPAA